MDSCPVPHNTKKGDEPFFFVLLDAERRQDIMRYEKKTDPFYLSAAWKLARQQALMRDLFLCQECLRRVDMGKQLRPRHATMVHHIKPRKLYPELALSLDNLESLCNTCHERMTPERHGGKKEKSSTRRMIVIGNEVGRDDRR